MRSTALATARATTNRLFPTTGPAGAPGGAFFCAAVRLFIERTVDIREFRQHQGTGNEFRETGTMMSRKLLGAALIGAGLLLAACNTVRGAADDLESATNCTENAMNGGNC